jgi:hypothetical protein
MELHTYTGHCRSTRSIASSRQPHNGRADASCPGLSPARSCMTEEGANPPDRDGQFRLITVTVTRCLRQGLPVSSVDTKQKELRGEQPQCRPAMACSQATHADSRSQFSSPQVPCADPYGGDDIGRNAGFVNGETDHDIGAFAVAAGPQPCNARWSTAVTSESLRRSMERSVRGLNDLGQAMNTEYREVAYSHQRW